MLKRKGFTLVEIMVVIAIIGILVAIVLAAGSAAKKVARDNQRRTDIKFLQLKLEAYKGDHGGLYPTSLGALVSTYVPILPTDPLNSTNPTLYFYKYSPLTISNTGCGSGSASYYLRADLENNNGDYSETVPFKTPPLSVCSNFTNYTTTRDSHAYEVVSPEVFQ